MWTAFRHSFSVRGRPSPRKTLFGLIHSCPTSYLLGGRGAFLNLLASLGTWTSVFPPRLPFLAGVQAVCDDTYLTARRQSKYPRLPRITTTTTTTALLCFNRLRHDCCLCRQYLRAVAVEVEKERTSRTWRNIHPIFILQLLPSFLPSFLLPIPVPIGTDFSDNQAERWNRRIILGFLLIYREKKRRNKRKEPTNQPTTNAHARSNVQNT